MIKLLQQILIIIFFNLPILAQGVGSPAPDFTLNSLSHGQISLSQFSGKVVYIYFVGYNCPPCFDPSGGPATEYSIWQVYQSYDFQAIGIDCWNGTVSQMQDFQFNTGITYPLCLNGGNICYVDYLVPAVPYSVIIDQSGIISYRDFSVDLAEITSVIDNLLGISKVDDSKSKITKYKLSQNYPNPFNPSTTIEFNLTEKAFVELNVYSLLGEEVAELVSQEMLPSLHRIFWNASEFPAGIYFYRLKIFQEGTPVFIDTKRLVLLK